MFSTGVEFFEYEDHEEANQVMETDLPYEVAENLDKEFGNRSRGFKDYMDEVLSFKLPFEDRIFEYMEKRFDMEAISVLGHSTEVMREDERIYAFSDEAVEQLEETDYVERGRV